MLIKPLESSDINIIVQGFANSGWTIKSTELFELYLQEQQENKRECYITHLSQILKSLNKVYLLFI